MFERYTEKARRVIFFARYEASELGAHAIEPTHLLLGLLREDQQLIIRFSNLTPPSLDQIRNRFRATTGEGEKLPASVDMPISNAAKHLLRYAADESKQLNHRHLGTEHLLLGLLRTEQTEAADVLIELGIDHNTVRDELRGRTIRSADIGKASGVEEMRRLAAEARNLATAIKMKAEHIEAICDQLTETSSDHDGETGENERRE